MSRLEEIIFIADYIEPNRKMITGLPKILELAFLDLTDCIVQMIENTLQYLEAKKYLVDDASKATYQFYLEKQKQERQA